MKDKIGYIIFHLFVIENCEKVIENYFFTIKESGLYEEVDHILMYIKYVDNKTLSKVMNILNKYNKVKILRCENRLSPPNKIVSNYIQLPSFYEIKEIQNCTRTGSTLGEGETLLHLFDDPKLDYYKNKYKLGAFIHSKSISHHTEWNMRLKNLIPISSKEENLNQILKLDLRDVESAKIKCLAENRIVHLQSSNSMIFQSKFFVNLSIKDYLKIIWSIEDTEENNKFKFFSKSRKEMLSNEGIIRFWIINPNDTDEYVVLGRVAISFFVDKMNFILNKKEYIRKKE